MSEVVAVSPTKIQLARLVERAHAGEEIILAKAGKPCARLVPPAPARTRESGFLAGTVEPGGNVVDEAMRPPSAEELADWE